MTDPANCREAVIEAMRRLERRHGRKAFRKGEIATEVESMWSRWKSSTVSTHISSHMVRGVSAHGWADLERLDHGLYQLATSDPTTARSRLDDAAQPGQPGVGETGAQFELRARSVLSSRWGVALDPGDVELPGGVRKRFDLVSPDGQHIGDAKRYTSIKTPAAKWSTIAEYVWLLQQLEGAHTFLVFGGDEDVPARWLARFAPLAAPVEFLFLDDDNVVRTVGSNGVERTPREDGPNSGTSADEQ